MLIGYAHVSTKDQNLDLQRDALTRAVTPAYYPPFNQRELPANPSHRMATALDALYRASVEVHRNLYRLTILHEISRDPAFVRKVNNTPVAHPMITIRGGLAYAVTISLTAVFDVGDTSASLRRVLRTLADRREEPAIRQLHVDTGIDANVAIARVRRLQARLNGGELSAAIGRLKTLRDQQLAHYDISPQRDQGVVRTGDVDRIFAFAANAVNTATAAAVKRLLKPLESYNDARKQARDFTAALRPMDQEHRER